MLDVMHRQNECSATFSASPWENVAEFVQDVVQIPAPPVHRDLHLCVLLNAAVNFRRFLILYSSSRLSPDLQEIQARVALATARKWPATAVE